MSDPPVGPSRTSLTLLRQELRDGLTFAALALDEDGDPATREHHRENAEAAYSTALRLVALLVMSDDEMEEITSGIARLRDALARIPG